MGSDGNYYVGDTAWHPDGLGEYLYGRIKVSFYLDGVQADTGCLRVIPGSHRQQLHEALRPLWYYRMKQLFDAGSLTAQRFAELAPPPAEPDQPAAGGAP